MKKIRLTEAQAWETLARFFGGLQRSYMLHGGLCKQMLALYNLGCIGWRIHGRLYGQVAKRMDETGRTYLWPRDKEGDKARAAFCWEQVERLKRAK